MLSLQRFGIAFTGFLFLTQANAQSDTTQKIIAGRVNAPEQQSKPYVIFISIDGYRYDYTKKYHAVNLLRLSQRGASAEYMIPSYPTLTFPNHYTLVTGMYPAHHGLVDNTFYDPQRRTFYTKKIAGDGSWYGGTPLWVLAEQKKMLTASFYWVGSEADIQGVRPTYYYTYNEKIPINKRLRVVKNWLQLPADKRPHLITFYFPEVDHEGHDYGPESKEVQHAIHDVDESIGKMVAMTDSLGLSVNFILVSDHGMTEIDTEHQLPVPKALDTATCVVSAGSTLIHVFVKDKNNTPKIYQNLRSEAVDCDVYLADDIPTEWHYGKKDDRYGRVGDILVTSHWPNVFALNSKPVKPGNHGFDPSLPPMRATFFAWGPQIKTSVAIGPFKNVNVYPLVAKILGLTYSHSIDGDLKVLMPLLK